MEQEEAESIPDIELIKDAFLQKYEILPYLETTKNGSVVIVMHVVPLNAAIACRLNRGDEAFFVTGYL